MEEELEAQWRKGRGRLVRRGPFSPRGTGVSCYPSAL